MRCEYQGAAVVISAEHSELLMRETGFSQFNHFK